MIFKLHYWLQTSGASVMGILMGVFMKTYTDATPFEIGTLFMIMPFAGIICRPAICALADRAQAHRRYMITCQLIAALSYLPFIVVPYLGPRVYENHARASWYFLASFKIVGDIAFGGMASIGDALAINYAKRINTKFTVYRVWGTISWMVFGLIIGTINEVWFMPKYVPGFAILILSSVLDSFMIFLWPPEYFVMISPAAVQEARRREKEKEALEGYKKESLLTKSLMPKELVWAHAKGQILWLLSFGTYKRPVLDYSEYILTEPKKMPPDSPTLCHKSGSLRGSLRSSFRSLKGSIKSFKMKPTPEELQSPEHNVSKMTQLRLLVTLMRKDARIVLYLMYFTCAGISLAAVNFFFIRISQICNEKGTCQFSSLAGVLQMAMASIETFVFIYVKDVQDAIGRVNLCAVAFLFNTIKYTFYGTFYLQVNPYFAALSETLQGIIFGIFLTAMVELGHLFANEVEYILPEMIERGIITDEADPERIKLSLTATMQAIISTAESGLGRGLGALMYGFLLEYHSFETVWVMIGFASGIITIVVLAINLIDRIFKLDLGLDVRARKELERQRDIDRVSTITEKPIHNVDIRSKTEDCESARDSNCPKTEV